MTFTIKSKISNPDITVDTLDEYVASFYSLFGTDILDVINGLKDTGDIISDSFELVDDSFLHTRVYVDKNAFNSFRESELYNHYKKVATENNWVTEIVFLG